MMTELTPNIRYVKCPKCLRILPELPNMSVYQCGGCGTILQAKKHKIEIQKPGLQETILPEDAEASTSMQETGLLKTGDYCSEKNEESSLDAVSISSQDSVKPVNPGSEMIPMQNEESKSSISQNHDISFDGEELENRFQEASDSHGGYIFRGSSVHQRPDPYNFDVPDKKKLLRMVWELQRLFNKRDALKGKESVFPRMAFTVEDANTRLQVDHICSHCCPSKHSDQSNQKATSGEEKKRFVLPFAGASPFITCQFCFKVLQLPLDFLIFPKHHHRVRCGDCSKVLTYSAGKGRDMITPRTHKITETDHAVSCSEDYGPSSALSESASDRTAKNYSEVEELKTTKSPHSPLHRLMGYSSPTEVIKGHRRQNSMNRSQSG